MVIIQSIRDKIKKARRELLNKYKHNYHKERPNATRCPQPLLCKEDILKKLCNFLASNNHS